MRSWLGEGAGLTLRRALWSAKILLLLWRGGVVGE